MRGAYDESRAPVEIVGGRFSTCTRISAISWPCVAPVTPGRSVSAQPARRL